MVNNPVISVVVPAYNEETLIGRCLSSLQNQKTEVPYEVIVVDNNSTDRTAAIARTFPVTVLHENQPGAVAARQKGLTSARGTIIACADSDSFYPSGWIQKIQENFSTHPDIIALVGSAVAEREPYWAHLMIRYTFWAIDVLYRFTGKVLYAGAFNFIYRKKAFLDLGGYRTYLDHGGDEWDVLIRLQKRGKIRFDPTLTMNLSTRCFREGFLHWLFVETIYYYIINFFLASIFKRSLVKVKHVRNI